MKKKGNNFLHERRKTQISSALLPKSKSESLDDSHFSFAVSSLLKLLSHFANFKVSDTNTCYMK